MAKKKTPIIVHLKKGRHKTQPWTFVIDDPGPGPKVTVRERYSNKRNAKIGAVRKLKGKTIFVQLGDLFLPTNRYATPDGREIIFK